MGEALLIKFGGEVSNPYEGIEVAPNYCTVLVTLYDSDGEILTDCDINARCGGLWTNTYTNALGQAAVSVNGQTTIYAYPRSLRSNFNYIDQQYRSITIPATTIQNKINNVYPVEITLNRINNLSFRTSYNAVQNGAARFRLANWVSNLFMIGGGGGGLGFQQSILSIHGSGIEVIGLCGGGGGASIIGTGRVVRISRSNTYYFTVGDGGNGSSTRPGTGGSTAAFGFSVLGGINGYTSTGWGNNISINTDGEGYTCGKGANAPSYTNPNIQCYSGGDGGFNMYHDRGANKYVNRASSYGCIYKGTYYGCGGYAGAEISIGENNFRTGSLPGGNGGKFINDPRNVFINASNGNYVSGWFIRNVSGGTGRSYGSGGGGGGQYSMLEYYKGLSGIGYQSDGGNGNDGYIYFDLEY